MLRKIADVDEPEIVDPLGATRQLWRVYFNRREDFPFLAAVDNGTMRSDRLLCGWCDKSCAECRWPRWHTLLCALLGREWLYVGHGR